jgi:hypothetical protein
MGFKLERSFSFEDSFRNFYYVSFPLFNGLGDIADSALGYPCDFAGGPGDGVINADDAICDMWTDRGLSMGGAAFTIQKIDTATCSLVGRTGLVTSRDNYFFTGGFTEDITTGENRERGYNVVVAKGNSDPFLENRAVIVGSHDPSFGGHDFVTTGCRRDIISVAYHTMYRTVDEILCGLESVDWDPDGSGNPDACLNGIYNDGAGLGTTVQRYDNDPASMTPNRFVGRTVFNPGGGLFFLGPDFQLTPGDAYLVNWEAAADPQRFVQPHF